MENLHAESGRSRSRSIAAAAAFMCRCVCLCTDAASICSGGKTQDARLAQRCIHNSSSIAAAVPLMHWNGYYDRAERLECGWVLSVVICFSAQQLLICHAHDDHAYHTHNRMYAPPHYLSSLRFACRIVGEQQLLSAQQCAFIATVNQTASTLEPRALCG